MVNDVLDKFTPKCFQCKHFKVVMKYETWDMCGCRPLYPLGEMVRTSRYHRMCKHFKWKY